MMSVFEVSTLTSRRRLELSIGTAHCFGTLAVVLALVVLPPLLRVEGAYGRSVPDVRRRRGYPAGAVQFAFAGVGGQSRCTDECADFRNSQGEPADRQCGATISG